MRIDPKIMSERNQRRVREILGSSAAPPTANVEPAFGHDALAAKKGPRFDTPVCIHCHSVRKRRADPDGISAKAAIDGLVRGGILADDNAGCVKEVSFTQERGEEERTVITISEEP